MTTMPLAALAALLLTLPAPQTTAPVEIPLSVQAGRLVIPVQAADGTPLRFLVSLGSAVTVLSESGAAKVGEGVPTMGGLALNMEGSRTLPDASLTVDGVVMDGLVSSSTLNEFDILFDVPGGRMVLKPFGRQVSWPGVELSDPVTLRIYHGLVVALDVEVEGTPYPAMLELGAPALLVNEAVLSENHITDGRAALTLGSVTLAGVPIEKSDHPSIERFSPNGDGFVIVGAAAARDCAMALSWVHRELRTCVR